MADDLLLKREPRESHPAGQYPALCVDLIDMGMRVQDFQGKESSNHSCVFIFMTGEKDSKGYEFQIRFECNVTFGERSKLLKFLTQWRGQPFQPQELSDGFKLASLVNKPALLSLIKKTSKTGNDYVVIDTVMPLPKSMPPPVVGKYERAPFWAQQKIEYALEHQRFLGRVKRNDPQGSGEPQQPDEPLGDEVPF